MKREHVASTSQIRLLKRENAAMRDEVEICSQKFRAADKLHKCEIPFRTLDMPSVITDLLFVLSLLFSDIDGSHWQPE